MCKDIISKEKNDYIEIGDMLVKIEYSKNKKTLNECMLNILKQKIEKN